MPFSGKLIRPSVDVSGRGHLPGRDRLGAAVLLGVACFLTLPASAQVGCIPPSGALGNPTCQGNSCGSFFSNFANPTYWTQLAGNASGGAGDMNAAYSAMYYSIANLTNAQNGYCQMEFVVVGTFPEGRYMVITDNDMHYASAQHLADADIDPVGGQGQSYTNPFVPDPPATSPPYNGAQWYLVPVSLGYIPNPSTVTNGCGIDPFEEDNLLDATERHLSMDWNGEVQAGNAPTSLHLVDTPDHLAPNTAGSIFVRDYLSQVGCTSASDPTTCQQHPKPPPTYFILRDVGTGCAYTSAFVQSNLLYNSKAGTGNPATAVVSLGDPSTPGNSNWLSVDQHQQHITNANVTPDACYANGNPAQGGSGSGAPNFYNQVAWTRSPEWVGTPGPDDSYIGGALGPTALAAVANGGANGRGVVRFRFQLPNMPNTPCPAPYTCGLTGSEQLRYTSLTFGSQQATSAQLIANPELYYVADPDGIGGLAAPATQSIVSLADTAFAKTTDGNGNNYVTLLVNVGPTTNLPAWLQYQPSGTQGQAQGVMPVANDSGTYSVWQVDGYTVLDMSQFTLFQNVVCSTTGSTTTCNHPLLMQIRNTLPSSTFGCSGAAVPFSTAEYTDAGGLMGPYVPLVDYWTPPATATAAGVPPLPSASACGVLPSNAKPTINPIVGLSNQQNFPQQYWQSSGSSPLYLNCGTSQATSPQILFATTQWPFSTPASQLNPPCTTSPNPCTNVVSQSLPAPILSEGSPPLPVNIVGSGFGYLPQPLPFAGPASSLAPAGSTYLRIRDCANDQSCSSPIWDTASSLAPACQVYIANWTDTSIWLEVNLPVDTQDYYQFNLRLPSTVSPLADVTPLAFFPSTTGQNQR
jgi:hypothetical protein